MLTALENVFSFDSYDRTLIANLQQAFIKHGIPLADLSLAGRSGHSRPVVQLAVEHPLPAPKPAGELARPVSAPPLAGAVSMERVEHRRFTVEFGVTQESEGWEQGRLHTFTEEKLHLKVAGGKGLSVCCLQDGSIHAMGERPLSLHSFFESSNFSRYSRLDLEEFIPNLAGFGRGNLIRLESAGDMVCIFSPTGYALLVKIPDVTTTSTDKTPAPLAIVPFPSSVSGSAMDYITAGFKMGPMYYHLEHKIK
jgi:hypothetical protein